MIINVIKLISKLTLHAIDIKDVLPLTNAQTCTTHSPKTDNGALLSTVCTWSAK